MDIRDLSDKLTILVYNSLRQQLLQSCSEALSKELKLSQSSISSILEKTLPSTVPVTETKVEPSKNTPIKKDVVPTGATCTHITKACKDHPEKVGKPCGSLAKELNEKGEPRCSKHKPKGKSAEPRKAPAKKKKGTGLAIPNEGTQSSIDNLMQQQELDNLVNQVMDDNATPTFDD